MPTQVESGKDTIVYCKDSNRSEDGHCSSFDFLGYTFRPRSARNDRGEFFVSFSPAMSQKAACRLRRTIKREWKLKSRTHLSLKEIARRINPVVTGWINFTEIFADRQCTLSSTMSIWHWCNGQCANLNGYDVVKRGPMCGFEELPVAVPIYFRIGSIKAG